MLTKEQLRAIHSQKKLIRKSPLVLLDMYGKMEDKEKSLKKKLDHGQIKLEDFEIKTGKLQNERDAITSALEEQRSQIPKEFRELS